MIAYVKKKHNKEIFYNIQARTVATVFLGIIPIMVIRESTMQNDAKSFRAQS